VDAVLQESQAFGESPSLLPETVSSVSEKNFLGEGGGMLSFLGTCGIEALKQHKSLHKTVFNTFSIPVLKL
jgi:hypothetical protein